MMAMEVDSLAKEELPRRIASSISPLARREVRSDQNVKSASFPMILPQIDTMSGSWPFSNIPASAQGPIQLTSIYSGSPPVGSFSPYGVSADAVTTPRAWSAQAYMPQHPTSGGTLGSGWYAPSPLPAATPRNLYDAEREIEKLNEVVGDAEVRAGLPNVARTTQPPFDVEEEEEESVNADIIILIVSCFLIVAAAAVGYGYREWRKAHNEEEEDWHKAHCEEEEKGWQKDGQQRAEQS